jgi:hypothetical protein
VKAAMPTWQGSFSLCSRNLWCSTRKYIL